jgi:hypothetical protein
MASPAPEVERMPTEDPTVRPTVSPRPRRRIPPFVVVGVVGVVVIAVLVGREVASIREGERETDRQMAELERQEAEEEGAFPWDLDGSGESTLVRLAEVQRQGPDTVGRYHLDVGATRWALDLPAADADEAAWAAWDEASRPRWTALALSLRELGDGGASVRGEIFAPWRDAPDAAPERLLLRLLPILAAAGILEVDVEHAPPALVDDE